MPVAPHLSRTEREAIATAAKIAASGTKVTWRNVGRRVDYVVGGHPHRVFDVAD